MEIFFFDRLQGYERQKWANRRDYVLDETERGNRR
jgi:hypothetical protein